ncbi:MAG: hypothetical protein GWP34_08355, partial [Alphaproteobacteria bacterium]|nr:hypothetical protein [Alphaproteobacteria bacterium]
EEEEEEEEDLLRKALRHDYRPYQLALAFWRQDKDIEAKAKEKKGGVL